MKDKTNIFINNNLNKIKSEERIKDKPNFTLGTNIFINNDLNNIKSEERVKDKPSIFMKNKNMMILI